MPSLHNEQSRRQYRREMVKRKEKWKGKKRKERKRQNARAVKIVKKMLARKVELRRQGRRWNEDNIVAAVEMSTVVARRLSSIVRCSSVVAKWTSGRRGRVQFEEKGGSTSDWCFFIFFCFCLWLSRCLSLCLSFFQQLVEFYLFCVNW